MRRYTKRGLRFEWKQQVFKHHHQAKVGGLTIGIDKTSVLNPPVRWFWWIDALQRSVADGYLPDAKTPLQAKAMAEEAALAWAKGLVAALEGGK